MTIIFINPQMIDPNPYQPRQDMDGEPLQRLAEDIKEHGLLQKPVARFHPDAEKYPGRYQLAFGHRRLAAWQIAFPGESIEVDVRGMTDQELFAAAIVENEDREDLSAIEKARAMQAYIDAFHVTQLEAGKLFGLTSQGAVSNLLRLLKLPAPIQALVIDGDLPERFARQVLPIAAVRPEQATKIASVIAKAGEDEREEKAKQEIWNMLRKNDVMYLHSAPWDLGWPGKSIASGDADIPELPACKGCPWNLRLGDRDNCLRPKCYKLKTQAWADHEAARVGKKLGISPVVLGERPMIIYNGEDRQRARAQKALANLKHQNLFQLLRIVPFPESKGYGSEWNRKATFGTSYVALATMDEKALDKALSSIKESKAKSPGNVESWQARQRAEQKKRNEQAKENRRLIDAALPALLPAFPSEPTLLNLFWNYTWITRSDWEKVKAADRPRVLLRAILVDKYGGNNYSPTKPADVVTKLERLAGEMKVKLPRNWSAVEAKDSPQRAQSTQRKSKAKPTRKAGKK